ncbi:biliverdin-producing heme oxygenase [Alysiella crassa]|uniref:Heme oxygenase n=1 Tax=Alysiella crassa TaxID=153491 RepID=A0A376BLN6_9NEIS|nr:biliverdin-producing heme oxygenase [Alysiella crassa]UOP07291.1 biliverdin-producing heme oxygenase [Alysiella crassa]SSY70533.1 Heme oxygenase [Alysiella crassa]
MFHTDDDEQNSPCANLTFAQFLKLNCQTTHDSVDNLVMSVKPFDSPEHYVKFLQLQAIFHKVVDDIYKNPELNQKIDGLAELARYDDVLLDLQDLQASKKAISTPLPQLSGAETLGWLYCAEGSNVGAAFLFKDAQNKLGFGAEHGARHLAPHADGRGKHWRDFVAQLNALDLSEQERAAALKGALDAFAFYKVVVREIFGVA